MLSPVASRFSNADVCCHQALIAIRKSIWAKLSCRQRLTGAHSLTGRKRFVFVVRSDETSDGLHQLLQPERL